MARNSLQECDQKFMGLLMAIFFLTFAAVIFDDMINKKNSLIGYFEIGKNDNNTPLSNVREHSKNQKRGLYPLYQILDPRKLDFLADMAFYAHQTYCLHKESSFISNDLYVWILPSYEKIQLLNGLGRAIIIQIRSRQLTPEIMERRDSNQSHVKYPTRYSDISVPVYPYFHYFYAKNKILKMLRKYLLNDYYKNHVLLFTGHGDGGVIAIYAALDIFLSSLSLKRHIEVTTFGAPRIGDEDFIKFVGQRFTINRVTYGRDYVPLYLSRRFKHPNTEYWIPYDDDYECCELEDRPQRMPLVVDCYLKEMTEHPECNLKFEPGRQDSRFIPNQAAHMGPYFGYTMGQCRKQITNWLPPFKPAPK
ncbi:hypothetical protein G9A89_006750 [Geosiphon pyriformis]|nr:hypothetical protein G9A89_006750 [Geosiphon pyriformis]